MSKLIMVLVADIHRLLAWMHSLQNALRASTNESLFPNALDHIQYRQIHLPVI